MTAVAIFSHYAPSEGFGGPARILHARRALEGAGHPTVHVVIQARHEVGACRRTDIVELVERQHGAPVDHIYSDVDLGRRAAADQRLVSNVTTRLAERGVSVIVLEQPFLAELVEGVAERLGIPVVYSCQNVEYRLRRELEQYQVDWRRSPARSREVRALEQRAVDIAASVTTIAETDRQLLRAEFGVDSTVVPNGSSLADSPLRMGPRSDVDFVFAGSSYWPNSEGFARIANPSLAFLPPTTRIHVAGTVSSHLLTHPAIARRYSVNAARLVTHGFVSISQLADLMTSARAVIVPIFVGEGSNLKSADALASGAPVVMTERATRGYEDVIDADPEGVVVAADESEFRRAMTALMAAPRRRQPVGHDRHRMLSWSARLAPLVSVVRAAA